MLSMNQINIIDGYSQDDLQKCISHVTGTNHKQKDEIVEYCEQRLERLNVDTAVVVKSDIGDMSSIN